jgi:hypothetical protein
VGGGRRKMGDESLGEEKFEVTGFVEMFIQLMAVYNMLCCEGGVGSMTLCQ